MTVTAILVVLFILIDPTLIATAAPMMIAYVVLTLILNGAKMCVTMSINAMMAIFWMTMSLYFGLPLIGWVCTLCAMRKTPLSKEKMEEVQKSIHVKKQAEVEKVIDEMK